MWLLDRRDRRAHDLRASVARPILIADQDMVLLATLAQVLRLRGYSVITATDAEQAIRGAARHFPALVLVDAEFTAPGPTSLLFGLDERRLEVPVVTMDVAGASRIASLAVVDQLDKPVSWAQLLAVVERYVERPVERPGASHAAAEWPVAW
jgi:DNA-binding NtrC family response regulator